MEFISNYLFWNEVEKNETRFKAINRKNFLKSIFKKFPIFLISF